MCDPITAMKDGEPDTELLRSDKAIVARRQVHADCGGATVHCVVLADGALIECGSDGYAEDRAKLLAAAVNQFGPERFAFGRRSARKAAAREDERDG